MALLLNTFFFLFVLVTSNGVPMECRHHHGRESDHKVLYVFGDSFVDAGGRPSTAERTLSSRSWFFPYGISNLAHDRCSTGRASDGMVQSDFLAKILGSEESPRPYRLQIGRLDQSGINFAVSGSGVFYDGEGGTPSLRGQIDQMESLVDNGVIYKWDMADSVALVAISSGHDYYPHINHVTNKDEMRALNEVVTNEITTAVQRLQDLGVGKVLVNLLPPIGCNPWLAIASNYSRCDDHGNTLARIHNRVLRENLDGSQNVLLLDLYAVFSSLVERENLVPCCKNLDSSSYCGELDGNGRQKYTLCENREDFFFWDYIHPTQAAWEDIMGHLEERIEDFLEIESSWN